MSFCFLLGISNFLKENGTYYTQNDVIDDPFLDLYLELNAAEIATLAHQSKDMIRKCSINNPFIEPKCEELENGVNVLFSPSYGVCYMFNNVTHDQVTSSAMKADWPGPSTGVKLIIDIESKHCFQYI